MKKLRFMLSCMAAVLAIVACSEKEELPAPDQGPGNENPDDSDPDDPGTPDDGMTYEMTAAYPQFAAAAAEGAVGQVIIEAGKAAAAVRDPACRWRRDFCAPSDV